MLRRIQKAAAALLLRLLLHLDEFCCAKYHNCETVLIFQRGLFQTRDGQKFTISRKDFRLVKNIN